MAKKLTAKTIENLRPKADRYEVSDGGGALRVVVQPSAHKAFAVRFRVNGKTAKLTLEPPWPALTLVTARRMAADAMEKVARGIDPAEARKAARQKDIEGQANTVASVCAAYMQREGKRLRTVDQRQSILDRLIYPHIGARQIDTLRRSEIVKLLDKIEDDSGQRMCDVTLATLRKIFNWHALRSDTFNSPIVRGMGRQEVKEHRRSRILDDDELRKVWATAVEGDPFAALVRFLLLTSARRGEAAGMRWDEIDGDVWTLPAARSKTKTEIIRPLSKPALAVLHTLPRFDGCPYVFTANSVTPIKSFSAPKDKLDAASGVAGWRLHDLRRTSRSLLSRTGVNADISERCLGHAVSGVRGIYDRHPYIDEMRHAFELLAAQIDRIVNPPDGKVVKFGRSA
jgi:integrase